MDVRHPRPGCAGRRGQHRHPPSRVGLARRPGRPHVGLAGQPRIAHRRRPPSGRGLRAPSDRGRGRPVRRAWRRLRRAVPARRHDRPVPLMLLLVDYSSLLYRAYHSTPTTVPWNGVYGFLGMMARILTDRRPEGLAVAADDDWRPAFRVDAIPAYKAHRVSDEPDPVTPHEQVGRRILEAFGICLVGSAGYEAEDVIAAIAATVGRPGEILSGDRDLFALVRDPDVAVLYPVRGVSELTRVDEAEITRRYGIPGRAYGDFAILRGDPSDGLPGVPGIGEKTAAALVAKYGSLDAMLAADPPPPKLNAAEP